MSWKPEVIADNSGKWTGNALRFATKEEALNCAKDLACRWTLVRETRAVEDEHRPNYKWEDGRLVQIKYDENDDYLSRMESLFGKDELLK